MKTEDIAALFDDRLGYRLVAFEDVGLPAYNLTTTVLTLQPKHYPAIDEFILRGVEAGLEGVPELSGFLGVDERVIEASASSLIRDEDLVERQGGVLALTRKSMAVLAGEEPLRPREQSLVFKYDALTRRVIDGTYVRLLAPREMRDRGMREIRAFPARKPEPGEIDADELQKVLQPAGGRLDEQSRILRVQSVTRGAALFIVAVMLIYRREAGDDVRVSFAIDGRLSEEHEIAFLDASGPTKMGITQSILSSPPRPGLSDVIGPSSAETIQPTAGMPQRISSSLRKAAIAQFKAEIAQKPGVMPGSSELAGASKPMLAASEPTEVEERDFERVRPVPVYEHPKLLEEALDHASGRVIVISPWITDPVVDSFFLRKLRLCLQRGVEVYIGYGIDGAEGRENDAIRQLKKIAKDDRRLVFVRLGNTHAKVLIKDDDWFVTTSFNWLSFKGDPTRTFREEWGTQVSIGSVVARYVSEILGRFRVAPSE